MNRIHLGMCQCFIDYTGHIIHNLQQCQGFNYSACKNSIHNRTIICNALINKRTMFHIGYAPLTDETITAHGAFMVLCDKKKNTTVWYGSSVQKVVGKQVGGGRPVLLGQRNRLRMRSAVAMGVAALLVVDGLSLCKGDAGAVISKRVNLWIGPRQLKDKRLKILWFMRLQTCLLGRGGKGPPQRTAGVEVRARFRARARAHQTTLLLLRRVVLFSSELLMSAPRPEMGAITL